MIETILGLPQPVFWFWFSAFIFVLSIVLLFPRFRAERSALMSAFFAFLLAMAWLHIFAGLGTLLKQMVWTHIGFFGGLLGVGYTLLFPLSALKQPLRSALLYLALTVAAVISLWMFLLPHESSTMILVGYLYMITIAGIAAGGYILWKGLQMKDRPAKVKAVGGGLGLMTCCLVADVWVLLAIFYGLTIPISGHFWMALAPVIILASIYRGRMLERLHQSTAPRTIVKI